MVWVDYDAAVSMHRVRTTNAAERRLARLASPGIDDNRISVLSPVGASLLGLAAGDETILPLPHGRSACIRICKVVWQPEAHGEYAL